MESICKANDWLNVMGWNEKATDTTNAKETLLAQGPVYVVKRHGRSMYNLMLLNRKASTDPSKETLNVWTAAVPLGPSSKLEVVGPQLFINCARTLKDFRLHFTEPVDVERMTKFCQYVPFCFSHPPRPTSSHPSYSMQPSKTCFFWSVQVFGLF